MQQITKKPTSIFSKRYIIAAITMLLFLGMIYMFSQDSSDPVDEQQQTEIQPEVAAVLTNSQKLTEAGFVASQNSPAEELVEFLGWLDTNNVEGFIGEAGWPDTAQRQTQAAEWLEAAQITSLPFTAWATGSSWPSSYKLQYFIHDEGLKGLNSATPQGELFKQYSQGMSTWGVNIAGLEFGTNNDGFSSTQPGQLGVDYFAEPVSTYTYLASQGVSIVRLPFNWERLQPTLYGELDTAYLGLILEAIDAADANGMQVLLDLHNYGRYMDGTTGTERQLSSVASGPTALPNANLSDVWNKIHGAVKDKSTAIYGYGLMNEPQDLPDGAQGWERDSQATVTSLREAGFTGRVIVGGYEWSKLQFWQKNHPDTWINDPLNNFQYEAHHYWDADGSGSYRDEQ